MYDAANIPPDLLAGFLDEAPDYLSALEEGLMAFEEKAQDGLVVLQDAADHERMNEVFRAAHSFKGISASLGLDRIRDLTHVMESLFDQMRTGKRSLSNTDVESLFAVVDTLRKLVSELSKPGDVPVSIEASLATMNAILVQPARKSDEPAASQKAKPADGSATVMTSDTELLQQFVETTAEAIDQFSQQLLALEERPQDADLINEAFRSAHNIKGASGAVGCRTMNRLTHDIESVLDRVRARELAIDESMMTALLRAVDRLRSDLTLIQEGKYNELELEGIAEFFTAWKSMAAEAEAADTVESDPALRELVIQIRFPKESPDAPILACVIHNRLADAGHMLRCIPDVFALDEHAPVDEITFHLQTKADSASIESVVKGYAVETVTVRTANDVPSAASDAKSLPVELSEAIPAFEEPKVAAADATSTTPATNVPQVATSEPRKMAVPAMVEKPAAREAPTPAKAGETMRVDLERLDQLMNLGGELVITKARFIEINRRLANLFTRTNVNFLVDEIADRLKKIRTVSSEFATTTDTHAAASELSEASLHLCDDFETIRLLVRRLHDSRGAMSEFGEAVHGLTRISEGIQRRIMQTRMVAIGPLFQRFRRVIRDICKATGKQVELDLHGEATELDKRMIDELVDPLTHMVRNSVDHGIESPEERRAAGKPETGTVVLDAFHRGRHICVEVRDDGKGLDVPRIRQKIVERELATAAQVEQMSDHEAMQYVFRPGFSTAQQVTDLSGRGMGMDIVITKIEALNGVVELSSQPGKGTTFTINLPLTLAIIPAMMVRIGECAYAVPLETVVEITTVQHSSIRHIQRQAAMSWRDTVVPLGWLEKILNMNHDGQKTRTRDEKAPLTVMILGCQNEKLGLVVDELIGQEDVVIKDVAANFQNVEGIAGASIMGNGSVSLILDVPALMRQFAVRGAQRLGVGEVVAVGA